MRTLTTVTHSPHPSFQMTGVVIDGRFYQLHGLPPGTAVDVKEFPCMSGPPMKWSLAGQESWRQLPSSWFDWK